MHDKPKNRIMILIASSILTGVLILLFFLDNSLEWNSLKILSCIIVSLWFFFIAPTIRNSYLLNKEKSLNEWFRMGLSFGASGIIFPILLSPFYGIKYYFNL